MSEVFEKASVPPPGGSTEFSLDLWDGTRSRGIRPTFAGRLSDDAELRREFLVGARMMGYELVDLDDHEAIARLRSMSPPRYPIQPQQLWLVDALNAPGYDEYVVEIVRRASKTTTILCWLLGRCACRPGYQVTFSAQNGVKSTARLREWKSRLDRTCPDPEAGLPPWQRGLATKPKSLQRQVALFGEELALDQRERATRGFRIMMGEVGKGIYFENGSTFLVFKPDAEAYRGEAGDVSWLDEAQEIDPEEGADLMAGLQPLQDTKEAGAIVISGTAGEARLGLFWERVDKLRSGQPDIGGVDYCAPEDTPWEHVEDEDRAMQLLQSVHPGIGTLTTLDKMRKRWRGLARPQWAREYLSLWPETFGTRLIDDASWTAIGLQSKPARPARVAFGLAIKPGGGSAAIAAAWRNAKGVAYVELVDHQSGTDWLPGRLAELSARYKGSTIGYDDIGEGRATATEAEAQRPKPRLRVITYRDMAAGCIRFLRDVDRGTLRHAHQIGLDSAIAVAAKREVRNDQGVWLFTPAEPGADITPLDAAARALRNWDQHYAGRSAGGLGVIS